MMKNNKNLFSFERFKDNAMTQFLVTEETRQQMIFLAEYAKKHPYSMDDLLDLYNGQKEAPGDLKEYTVFIPVGYKIVFSIENQVKGDLRHLSISVNGELPHPIVVQECMEMLGFRSRLEDCLVKEENTPDGKKAINILEFINP